MPLRDFLKLVLQSWTKYFEKNLPSPIFSVACVCMRVCFFFYQGFLSRTVTTHRIVGEGRGPFFLFHSTTSTSSRTFSMWSHRLKMFLIATRKKKCVIAISHAKLQINVFFSNILSTSAEKPLLNWNNTVTCMVPCTVSYTVSREVTCPLCTQVLLYQTRYWYDSSNFIKLKFNPKTVPQCFFVKLGSVRKEFDIYDGNLEKTFSSSC